MKVAVVANTAWYLYNFRRNLMLALQHDGHQVVAIACDDGYGDQLQREGLRYRSVVFTVAGTSMLREWSTVFALRRTLRQERVDVALTYTPKGTIYTALALTGSAVPTIVNISGLGRAFVHPSWLTAFVQRLYRIALGRAHCVFFQNKEDRQVFLDGKLLPAGRARLLPGSGVDLERFQPRPARVADGALRVLMVARLLWSKGLREYVDAARSLAASDGRWRFALLGALDTSPVSGVPRALLDEWVAEGVIDYLGTTDDVRPHLAAADCVVLPSYREGVPRSLLEAAAMARPVITTDAPGCRDCVEPGSSGYLCQPRDAQSLARALEAFAALSEAERLHMGLEGRRKMEREFDECIVIRQYRQAMGELSQQNERFCE